MARKPTTRVEVRLSFGRGNVVPVGSLALDGRAVLLEYDERFIASGLHLNPLARPTPTLVRGADPSLFHGLPGVLADSLPDAWGEELLRRRLLQKGELHEDPSALRRLAMIGSTGTGALTYEPEPAQPTASDEILELDGVAGDALAILDGRGVAHVEELYRLAGSSGGARPKIRVTIDDLGHVIGGDLSTEASNAWLVKFRGPGDPRDVGALEAAYADMARDAGLNVSETRLLPAKRGTGFFATRRFDRKPNGGRLHFESVAGLLEVDWRAPSIDYTQLLALARRVCGHLAVEEMFRRMVFNVAAHNRDDHTKQHAFLMNASGNWQLAPAYDLTFSSGPGGEHYLSVDGRGRDISLENVLNVARASMIDGRRARRIVDEVRSTIVDFAKYAKRYDVSVASKKLARGIPLL